MRKKVAPIKTYYYSDELNDDFAATKELDEKILDERYNYFRLNNIFTRLGANFLYYVIVKPLVFLALKFLYHYKIINKKAFKLYKGKKGYFIFGNHTNYLPDAAFGSLLKRGRNYVIVTSQTVNIKGISWLVQDLGAIPLGNTLASRKNFFECVENKIKENASITIYPEAHIWPYYTGLRPFKKDSFVYPVELDVPIFVTTTCYQKRRFGIRPKIVLVVDGPFYKDPLLTKQENIEILRDKAYNAMNVALKKYSTYEYIHYEKKLD